ncbi:HNH endonuclease signature motif containing protein [Metallibacterium sp.]|uniref:HNH endonuclease signature motif containing protein n=1 Tax=Metallibacterium sp. TaxID=2940281 RepID=UPI00263713D7|nr:HNH endonuclease signature motif containing protein [Metallibacterium sp.]
MNWTNEQLAAIWAKANPVPNNDPNAWRKDACGAWIGWQFYGSRRSQCGWEVDHITPVEHGGSDAISNLRPLHWKNNASKQDGRLTCPVRANGTSNSGI